MIDLYRSLFLCLLNLAVHGSLDLLIAGTEEAQLFVTGAFQAARIEIQGAVGDINSGLAASIKTLNMIPGYAFGPVTSTYSLVASTLQLLNRLSLLSHPSPTSPSPRQSYRRSLPSTLPSRRSLVCARHSTR